MKKKLIVFIILLFSVLIILKYPSKAKRHLPKSATEIRQQSHSVGGGDIAKSILKARITAEEFEQYRKKMGFVPIPQKMKKNNLWQKMEWQEEWWDPSEKIEDTFCDPTFGSWADPNSVSTDYRIIKHENGFIYYYYKDI